MVELEGQDDSLGARRHGGLPDDLGHQGDTESGERVLVEEVLPAHGLKPPLTASDHDRYAYVIEGRLGAYVGHTVTAGPGSVLWVPRGAAAALWNDLPRDCPETRLVVTQPADGGNPTPLAVEPAACGPDTRIAVLHVWAIGAGQAILAT